MKMASRKQRVAAAIIYTVLTNKTTRARRKCWIKSWLERRSVDGAFVRLTAELRMEDQQQFFNFIRMTATDFEFLLERIGPLIKKKDTHFRKAISPAEKLMVTLRFLATGDNYVSLMYLFRIAKSTISLIIPKVCAAIYDTLKDNFVKLPSTEEDWINVADRYAQKWHFPHCIGALDGKHVVIKCPENSGSIYYNYKGTYSIVLMIVVDADYKILYMNSGCIGRVSDGGVFRNTALFNGLEQGTLRLPPPTPLAGRQRPMPYVLVADDAFALSNYLMKPYPYKSQSISKRVYNYRLSRARAMVESVFGVMASRYRILRNRIELPPKKVELIVSAICVLHNFMMSGNNAPRYGGDLSSDRGREEDLPRETLLPLEQRHINHNLPASGQLIRNEFSEYFVSPEGELPWQYQRALT